MNAGLGGAYGVPGLTHKLPCVLPGQPPEAEHGGVTPGHEAHQAPGLHLAPPHAGLRITPGLARHGERLALAGVILLVWIEEFTLGLTTYYHIIIITNNRLANCRRLEHHQGVSHADGVTSPLHLACVVTLTSSQM